MTILKFIFAMFLSFLPGLVGLLFAPTASGQNVWSATLNNSVLTPDGWVFSVVWGILYILLGVALFLVIQRDSIAEYRDRITAYTLFAGNLILNALWTWVFFGLNLTQISLIVLVALIVVAMFMSKAFYRIRHSAFWLTVPYLLWLLFACYLNTMIVYMN